MRTMLRFMQKKFRNSALHKSRVLNFIYVSIIRRYVKYSSRKPINFRGFRINIHPSDVSVSPGIISGNYERFELDLCRLLVEEGSNFVDVGANIGVFSLEASRAVGEKGTVICVEPERINVELLRQNLQINEVRNAIIIEAAISNFDGQVQLSIDGKNSGTHRLASPDAVATDANACAGDLVTVRSRSLISVLHDCDISSIRLLKVDVEGFEPCVLTEEFLGSNPPDFLLIEFVPRHLIGAGFDPESFLNRLTEYFEDYFVVMGSIKQLLRVNSRDDILKMSDTNLLFTLRRDSFRELETLCAP